MTFLHSPIELQFSNAVEAGNLELIRDLAGQGVSLDTPIDDGYESPPITYCALEGCYDVAKLLLELGAKADIIGWGGATPDRIANSKGHLVVGELIRSHMFKAPDLSEVMDKDTIFEAREPSKQAILDHPVAWQRFGELAIIAEETGSPITKADLCAPNARGFSWLEKAAMFDALEPVADYLTARGEPILTDDLLELSEAGAPQPNGLLRLLSHHETGQLSCVFKESAWKGQSVDSLRDLHRQIPETAHAHIGSFHGLVNQLSRAEQQSTRIR